MRIDGDPGFHPGLPDSSQGPVQMPAGFFVDGQDVGTCVFESLDIAVGIHDHQVYVKRFLGMFLDGLDHRLAYCDIGNEHPVHHIDMEPVGLGIVNHFHGLLQVGEVGRKQRR